MSSRRRERRRACEGKLRMVSKDAAISHAFSLRHLHRAVYDAYSCPFCGGWHVGRRTKDTRHAIASRWGQRARAAR